MEEFACFLMVLITTLSVVIQIILAKRVKGYIKEAFEEIKEINNQM